MKIRFNRLIAFFLANGLLVLAFEIFLAHHQLLNEKPATWIPIVFGSIGGILTFLIVLIFNRFSYYLFLILMTISVIVGTLGLYFHNMWRFPALKDFIFNGKPFDFQILTTYTPLLAPSAFAAIGVLGIILALYYQWGNEKQ